MSDKFGPKKDSRGICMDATTLAEVSALDSSWLISPGGFEGASEMMSSRASQIVFHHWLHVRIGHPSLRVAMLESATSRAELLESKMTALKRTASRSESLESKVMAVLKHTLPSVVHWSHRPSTISRKSELSRRGWSRCHWTLWKRTVSNRADAIWPMQQPAPFAVVRFFWQWLGLGKSNSNYLPTIA